MFSRVTMRDVARFVGLDPSTVSLALRDHPRISVATRDRVRRAAAELGFTPDPTLGVLASYRRASQARGITATLGWVNRWNPPARLYGYAEFAAYWLGAVAAAEERGYRLVRFDIGDAPLARLSRLLDARGVAGVIVPPHEPGCGDWAGLERSRLAVVRIGHSVELAAHAVGCDQAEAAMLAWSRMRDRGYRRIGFVTQPGGEAGSRFSAGFLFAQSRADVSERVPVRVLDGDTRESERAQLAEWLALHVPDAILTAHAGVRLHLADLGVRVPDDVGLAATSVLDGDCDTGLDQCSREIGRAAVELLDGLLVRREFGASDSPRMTTLKARWVDGGGVPGLVRAQSTG